jgi:hypothetical protein
VIAPSVLRPVSLGFPQETLPRLGTVVMLGYFRSVQGGAAHQVQGGFMATQADRLKINHLNTRQLPSRFPEGTRFVIEGRAGRINLQYLEFPDGRHIDLPTAPAIRLDVARMRRTAAAGRKSGVRKI